MKRPRIKIPLTNIDWILEIIGTVFLILLIVYPWYYFDQLPETIPTHFNFFGEPDGFGSKDSLRTLATVGVVLYVGITILNFFPHLFNYLQKITKENAANQYRLLTVLMRRVKLLIAICFFEIEYGTIQIALYSAESLNTYFMPVFLIANLAVLGNYFYRAFKQ